MLAPDRIKSSSHAEVTEALGGAKKKSRESDRSRCGIDALCGIEIEKKPGWRTSLRGSLIYIYY